MDVPFTLAPRTTVLADLKPLVGFDLLPSDGVTAQVTRYSRFVSVDSSNDRVLGPV